MKSLLRLLAALLIAGSAQAATLTVTGVTDALDPLPSEPLTGQLSFDTVASDFTGSTALTAFHVQFAGLQYELNASAVAWFDNGTFLGVDYLDDAQAPALSLWSGFFDLSEAYFFYSTADGVGFGSLVFEEARNAVPLPGTLALAGLGLLALARRRRA